MAETFALPASSWPRGLDPVARLVTHDLGAAPGCVVAACVRSSSGWRHALGAHGVLQPGGPPVTPNTVFDLASVTKPFTALTAARLHRQRPLLGSALASLLPEARGTASADVPIELLLAHRAGLDGHRPLYAPLLTGQPVDRPAALREAAMARRVDCEGAPPAEGFAPVYSDLGYLLVGEALERAAGRPLAELVRDEVVGFSGGVIESAWSVRSRGELAQTAPTEQAAFRGGVVQAAVHDENAWALGGLGVCGHAGLFGDAVGVARLGVLLLSALAGELPGWLTPGELAPLLRLRPGGTLRAGFDGKSASGSSAGQRFGPASFGHLGFTGTSLWVDPERQLVVALLTNRVHPLRTTAAEQIKRARPLAHDAVVTWAAGE